MIFLLIFNMKYFNILKNFKLLRLLTDKNWKLWSCPKKSTSDNMQVIFKLVPYFKEF